MDLGRIKRGLRAFWRTRDQPARQPRQAEVFDWNRSGRSPVGELTRVPDQPTVPGMELVPVLDGKLRVFTRADVLRRIGAEYDRMFRDTPDAVLVAGPKLRAGLLAAVGRALDQDAP